MADRSATARLGMDDFDELSRTEENGKLFLLVETTDDVVGCPSCGRSIVGHGRAVVQVREAPMAGRTVRLGGRTCRCTDQWGTDQRWRSTTPPPNCTHRRSPRTRWSGMGPGRSGLRLQLRRHAGPGTATTPEAGEPAARIRHAHERRVALRVGPLFVMANESLLGGCDHLSQVQLKAAKGHTLVGCGHSHGGS